MATYLGVIDEEQINNMSYVFFDNVLTELGHRLNYDAIVNYAGNSFVEKSWDMIQDSNPMTMGDGKHMSNRKAQSFVDFLGKARVVQPGSVTPIKGKG